MAKEFDVLKEQANVIKNEVEDGANTASRVGGMFVDVVEKIQDEHIDVVQELGADEDAVMSQKTVTDELKKINSNTGIDEYPVFSDQTAYKAGDVVNYMGKLYQFTSGHAAGAWNSGEVMETSLEKIQDGRNNEIEENKFIINTQMGVFNWDSPTWFTDFRNSNNRCVSDGYKATNMTLLIPDGYLAALIYGDKNGNATLGSYKAKTLEISSDILYFRIVAKKTDDSDFSNAVVFHILYLYSEIKDIKEEIESITDNITSNEKDITSNEKDILEINKSYIHKSIPLFINTSFSWGSDTWFTETKETSLRASTKGFKYSNDSLLISPNNIAIFIAHGDKNSAIPDASVTYSGRCSYITKENSYPYFRIIAKKIDDSEVSEDDVFNGIEIIEFNEYANNKKIYWTQGSYNTENFTPILNANNLATTSPIIGNCIIKLKEGYKVYYVFEFDGFTITKNIRDFPSYNNSNNIIYTGGKNIIITVGDINRSEEVPLDGSVIEDIVYFNDIQKTYSLYNKLSSMISIISNGWTLDENGYLKNNSLSNKLILDREYALNPRKFIFNFILENGIAYFGSYPSKYRLQPRTRALFSVDLSIGKFSVYKIPEDNTGNVDDVTDIFKQEDILDFESYKNKDLQIELYHNFDNDYYANLIDGITGKELCSLTGLTNTTVGYMFERPYCYSSNNLTIKGITINTSPVFDCHLMIFGDSITEGAGATNFSKSYCGIISKTIGNNKVIVSGRSSGIIDNVIERVRAEAIYLRPKYIMVTIGTNGENTEDKLIELIELIKSINAIPIINHIPMLQNSQSVIARNNMIDGVINKYKDRGEIIRCAKYDIVTSIDNIPSLGQNVELFSSDKIHPNDAGHDSMFLRTKLDIPELF